MSSQLRVDKILPVDGAPTGGGGGIIQMQMGVSTSQSTTTSGNYDATALSASITPKFNTSKIFIMISGGMNGTAGGGDTAEQIAYKIYRSVGGASFAEVESSANGQGMMYMGDGGNKYTCLLYTSPSPRDTERSRMPSSA